MPLPPTSYTVVNLFAGNAVFDELHGDTKYLDILIAAFVVKEQHVLEVNPAVLVDAIEMCLLVAGVYFLIVKVVYCACRSTRRARDF